MGDGVFDLVEGDGADEVGEDGDIREDWFADFSIASFVILGRTTAWPPCFRCFSWSVRAIRELFFLVLSCYTFIVPLPLRREVITWPIFLCHWSWAS